VRLTAQQRAEQFKGEWLPGTEGEGSFAVRNPVVRLRLREHPGRVPPRSIGEDLQEIDAVLEGFSAAHVQVKLRVTYQAGITAAHTALLIEPVVCTPLVYFRKRIIC
jgi:hypothetical protein